jgi:hypothetical protein
VFCLEVKKLAMEVHLPLSLKNVRVVEVGDGALFRHGITATIVPGL